MPQVPALGLREAAIKHCACPEKIELGGPDAQWQLLPEPRPATAGRKGGPLEAGAYAGRAAGEASTSGETSDSQDEESVSSESLCSDDEDVFCKCGTENVSEHSPSYASPQL